MMGQHLLFNIFDAPVCPRKFHFLQTLPFETIFTSISSVSCQEMQPSDVFIKLQKIIKKDGYNISIELITELKNKCTISKHNKLPIVGECYHCCTDDQKNIIKIPTPSYPTSFRERYRHRCGNTNRSILNGKSCNQCHGGINKCGFYIACKNETFQEYVQRVYKEYFGDEVEESKDNGIHVTDIGSLFFGEQDKITPEERRKILQNISSYEWYNILKKHHRKHILFTEQYLVVKYRQNRELYCHHICYLLDEMQILSMIEKIINIHDSDDDNDLKNDDIKESTETLSQFIEMKGKIISAFYDDMKQILNINNIDITLCDFCMISERFSAIMCMNTAKVVIKLWVKKSQILNPQKYSQLLKASVKDIIQSRE
eukprot:399265_1